MMILGQRSGNWNSTLTLLDIIFNSYSFENSLENWKQFDGRFLEEREVEV